jgi:hypothetical protein
MVSYACDLLPNPAKVPNIRHNGTLSIDANDEKTQESWIWAHAPKKCAPCFRGTQNFLFNTFRQLCCSLGTPIPCNLFSRIWWIHWIWFLVHFDPETGMQHALDTKGFPKNTNFGYDWLLRSKNLSSRRFKRQKVVFELRNVYGLWSLWCSIDQTSSTQWKNACF